MTADITTADITTGIELELVLPEGTTRFDLVRVLAERLDAEADLYDQFSKVPLAGLTPPEIAAVAPDLARHHGAEVQSIARDFSCLYLKHRAWRLATGDRWVCSVVHDNTLEGGERVAEVVTAPLSRPELGVIRTICAAATEFEGTHVPDGAALHVHLDGAAFEDARVLNRLVQAYLHFEGALFEIVERSEAFKRAGPMPEGFADLLELTAARGAPWSQTAPLIAAAFRTRDHGLNLYNLPRDEPDKRTVELKIAAGTLDAERVIQIREVYVRLGLWAMGEAPMPEALP